MTCLKQPARHSLIRFLIQGYRYSFAFLFGGQCRFVPTCSVYAIEAIEVHGLGQGRFSRRRAACAAAIPGGNTALIPSRRVLSKRRINRPGSKPTMDNNNNLIAAVILSVIILVGFQYLYVKPQQEHYKQQVLALQQAEAGESRRTRADNKPLRERAIR